MTVSIIIPTYNILPYLDRCLQSIVNQTHRELQIILVDDGSTDGSGERCEEWAQKDARIFVIHQKNSGLSAARNAGLRQADGDYIGFIDSDDWIHKDMISRMLQAIEAEDAEIAICNYKTGRSKQGRSTKGRLKALSCDGARAASMVLRGHPSGLMVWNKLYRRSLLPYLTFSEGHVYEGKTPLLNAMLHSGRVVFLPDALYYYTKRTDSITNSITLANEMDRVRSAQDSTAIISASAPELMPDMQHLAAKMNALTWMRLQFC